MVDHNKAKKEPTETEEQLLNSLHFLQSLVDTIPTPIFYKDTRGIYTGCNKSFEKYLGLSKEAIIGKTVYEVSPKKLADMYRKMDNALFKDKKPQIYQAQVRYTDGTLHNVVFHKALFYNLDGSLGGLIGVIFDITDRLRAQKELERSHAELEKRVDERTAELMRINESLNKEKARAELYVDLMGHDINNMDQIATGYIELAMDVLEKKGALDEETRALLEKPIEALKSTSKLIDNVKKLQKERVGAYKAVIVDIDKMLDNVVKQYGHVSGRDVRINYIPVSGCSVKANELLVDVFSNLMGNAIRHSTGSLTITIKLKHVKEEGKDYCRVSVEDNGPGIPDDLKKRLFDRLCLYRARAGGKGFGLCLIKMLLDDFNGKFWVEDRVQGDYAKGCRFVVMLPAVPPA